MPAWHKRVANRQLTATDLEELERILRDCGIGTRDNIERVKSDAQGLGLFRPLIGRARPRRAAKAAFAGFLSGRPLAANQIELVNMIVDHLTENGVMDPSRLYETPYTDLSPSGVDGVFPDGAAVDAVVAILDDVKRRAAA